MANRFKLAFMIVEKFNPVYQSKQVACVVLTTAIANIDCKYMKFCAWDMYRSYMLAPGDFFWNQFKKMQLIQSQVAFILFMVLNAFPSVL